MSLEEKIKELEKQLNLKKAYECIKVSFPKGNSIPADIKKQVEENVATFCEMMAEKIDNAENQSQQQNINQTPQQRRKPSTLKEIQQAEQENAGEPLKALLLTTDNLNKEMKQLITSNAEVQVVSLNDTHASIAFETKKGPRRAAIPKEDLEFTNELTGN